MINFRYHLVSIVAVFLAIAIGVVIGSTVIDSATVSVLRQQQESLDNRIDNVEAENGRLSRELARYEERDEQLADQAAVLVDAKGVARLYEGRLRKRDLSLLVLSALLAMLVVAVAAEPIHVFLEGIWLTLRDLWF